MRSDVLAFMQKLNKELGPGAAVWASDLVVPKRFSTGSLSLDVACGGGLPGNQWVEVLGWENAGKTAVIYKTIATNQRSDPDFTTFWLAAESYDTDQAAALGVDNARVQVSPTRQMELGLDMVLDATASKAFDCIVVDSFPALLPDEERAKAMNENVMTVGARRFNSFWRKMGEASLRDPFGNDRPFVGLMVNQWRDAVGVFSPNPNVRPKTSPGGHGKDFSYYTRLDISRDEWITENRPSPEPGKQLKVKVGQVMKVTTVKNKAAAPQQVARVKFFFRDAPLLGFKRGDYDLGSEYVTLGILFGVIRKSGGWYYFGDQQWNGKPAVEDEVRADRGLQDALAAEVLKHAADPSLELEVPEEPEPTSPRKSRKRQ